MPRSHLVCVVGVSFPSEGSNGIEIGMLQTDSRPDVASEKMTEMHAPLEWVGMSGIEAPVLLPGSQMRVSAKVDAYVDLASGQSRGIHMSRLFKIIQTELTNTPISKQLFTQILESMLETHKDLSSRARVILKFEALMKRDSLRSENWGWRSYPVQIEATLQKGQAPKLQTEVSITYSSTCPASAALSRQLVAADFAEHFTELTVQRDEAVQWLTTPAGIAATPHAQRSVAKVKVETSLSEAGIYESLIDLIEEALQTPVQAAVKREDEQQFARLNGQNPLFCEDAARVVQKALNADPLILGFTGEFRHLESLHPHDAVAVIQKTS